MAIWGELASLGAALVWAIASLLLKPLSTQFPALALNGLRSLTAAIFFILLLLPFGKASLLGQLSWASAAALFFGTLFAIALGESLFLLSLRYLDVSRSYPISMCGYPLVTALLAASFLGETLTWLAVLGAVLLLVGIFWVISPRGGFFLRFNYQEKLGLLWVGLSVLASGIGTILIQYGVSGSDILAANTLRYSGTTVVILALTFRYWVRFVGSGGTPRLKAVPPQSPKGKLRLVAVGALSGLLGFGIGGVLFLAGLKYAGAARTSLLSSVSPLFLLPMAVLFLKERVNRRLVLGVVIAVVGVGLVVAG